MREGVGGLETVPVNGAVTGLVNGSAPALDASHWYGAAMRQRLAAFARRFVGDAWEAEDIAQETLVRAGRGLGALRRSDRAEAWLFRICRHAAIDHVRSRRVRRGVWASMPLDGEEWAVPAAPESDDGIGAWPGRRDDASLHAADGSASGHGCVAPLVDLRALPAHHRLLMSLYYERGFSQSKICRMTGLSASALRVRLFRARGVLAAGGTASTA